MTKIPLNRKLSQDYDMFALSKEQEPDFFGVEVELEGYNIVDRAGVLRDYWAAHQDGSLRAHNVGEETVEYVFFKPLNMVQTTEAIRKLCDYLTAPGRRVNESYRTSIHVHVNCLQETLGTTLNYVTIATILDELLVSQNGEHRIGNNFCLRMRDAEGILRDLIQSINQHGHIFGIHAQERYSSVNIASLAKFGTIEFRSLECTHDYPRIMHWIHTLQAMKEAARNYRDPTEVISSFSMMGPAEFLKRTLKEENARKYLGLPNLDRTLYDGMRLAQDLAFCNSWELKEDAPDKAKVPRKRPPRIQEIQPMHLEFDVEPERHWRMPDPLENEPADVVVAREMQRQRDRRMAQIINEAAALNPAILRGRGIVEVADPEPEDDDLDQILENQLNEEDDEDQEF